MRFVETPLPGVLEVESPRHADERGWFRRVLDAAAFEAAGQVAPVLQASLSHNDRAGTLRGMHYQRDPHAEHKLIRCVRGAIWDVALDLRPASPTHRRWHAVELSEDGERGLYVPPGVAHGFQTLVDGSDVLYMIGEPYVPDAAAGVRWDDPAFAIDWPAATARVISARDAAYPDVA